MMILLSDLCGKLKKRKKPNGSYPFRTPEGTPSARRKAPLPHAGRGLVPETGRGLVPETGRFYIRRGIRTLRRKTYKGRGWKGFKPPKGLQPLETPLKQKQHHGSQTHHRHR